MIVSWDNVCSLTDRKIQKMEIVKYNDNLFVIKKFLSDAVCDAMIEKAETEGFEEAKVDFGGGEQRVFKGIRNNERILYKDEILAKAFWKKAALVLPEMYEQSKAIGFNELFRFYKYTKGQRFKMHVDGSFVRNEKERSQYTFLMYLNDDFEGGATLFYEGQLIQPSKGDSLVFKHELRHEGTEVKEGTKYVLRTDVMYQDV